ncbi:Alkaline phosphatase synthesis transcriptional regulatory protein SphR [Paenibacillus allorhizosphaerae]|uniref:Alkaline phosphatase synthesis transcriptional regulatory protein SphR n=2 Tax=Paenibacillus allorhizosphaerae TaxID=2849866 RepID=A0ABM8VIA8_9BACL|nr:Alkaline phosphatase synthesis transcriptional regulatory protein SphR [Paenibacillus allorhizosphaerae]
MNGGNILVVEDEADIREVITAYLEKEGFRIRTAGNTRAAMEAFRQEQPDLAILDIILPDGTGTDLCRQMREMSELPILFVTCKRDSEDVLNGFNLGADDYVTKPFDPAILVARVNAQLRRNRQRQGRVGWRHKRLEVDFARAELLVDGEPVALFAKERQLLHFFIEHPNQVFSVNHLFERIWGWDSGSDERTVMVHVSNLRKKIEEDPANPRYLQTVRGFGYRFSLVE